MCEITVILKREDKTYKEKFLCYDPIQIAKDYDDPQLLAYIEEAKKNLQGEPDEVTIKITISL